MKTALVLTVLILSQLSIAGDLSNRRALDGSNRGRLCKNVVSELLSSAVGAEIQLESYENLTPGSFNQEYEAVFTVHGQVKTALLSGSFDCDELKVISIR